jgi:hypothetical protein
MAIVAVFMLIGAVVHIKNKTEETLDTAKETMENVGQTTSNIKDVLGNFSGFFRPKKTPGIADFIEIFFRR